MNLHDIPTRRASVAGWTTTFFNDNAPRQRAYNPTMTFRYQEPVWASAQEMDLSIPMPITRARRIVEDIYLFRSMALSGGIRERELDRLAYTVSPQEMYELQMEYPAFSHSGVQLGRQDGRMTIAGVRVIVVG